ncbi:MAG TPA: sigma-70 family RNA polymerase sigma factor [Candidatus Baltobacteraceae bacterium]|nr:sigma-70 family RNA polymerase sigma factor [Candidatus Baltobacteraceae bacterium]
MTVALCAPASLAPGFDAQRRRTLHHMMPASESDEALAAGFAGHERAAFSEAYRRYSGLLYSAAYNVLGNAEEAQDCVHDALARLWRSSHAFSLQRGSLRAFLVVCVRNEAISRRRRKERDLRLARQLAAFPEEHEELHVSDPIERDRVRHALEELPVDQRRALELAYYGGKTHTEIAAELSEPLGTIKSRIKLGLRKVAATLTASAPEYGR